ncbi:MAG TPA: YceI family protein [Hyphomicrobiales bacterium]|nr:YceI family protein [Hyphomicrobiales bacterium]
MKKLLGVGLALCLVGPVQAADYVIDGSGAGMHSSVSFRAIHVGVSALWGRFNDISGNFSYDAANPAASTITVSIDPASIDTNHAERDTHLRTADYLDVAKFPEAGFVSTSVMDMGNGKLHIMGNFTLHGVTREISFEAVKTGEGETPFGDYRVGFEADTVLDVADYGIGLSPVSELRLLLAIEGVRQ